MTTNPPLKNAKVVSTDTFNTKRRFVVDNAGQLTAGQTATFNVATLLETDAGKYDLSKIQVEVFVKDSEVGSVTNGYWVDAVAVAAVGWKETGEVIIVNQHQATQTFYIRISVLLRPVG